MSLIIISEPKNKNGKYELTEGKLRDLIQEAYDKGYKDGQVKPKYELQPYTLPCDGNKGFGKQVCYRLKLVSFPHPTSFIY